MYLDILSQSNFVSVNKKLIKTVGLKSAVYLAVLMDVLKQVQKKKKFDAATGFFTLDRKYMEEETDLDLEDQAACDIILKKAGVLDTDDSDPYKLRVCAEKVVALITESDPKLLADIAKNCKLTKEEAEAIKRKVKESAPAKKKKELTPEEKAAKQAGLRTGMKNLCANIVGIPELIDGYDRWVDSIYDIPSGTKAKNFLTKAVIENFHATIYSFTKDLRVYKKILEIAAIRGYSDHPEWAIDQYKRNPLPTVSDQKVAVEVRAFNAN